MSTAVTPKSTYAALVAARIDRGEARLLSVPRLLDDERARDGWRDVDRARVVAVVVRVELRSTRARALVRAVFASPAGLLGPDIRRDCTLGRARTDEVLGRVTDGTDGFLDGAARLRAGTGAPAPPPAFFWRHSFNFSARFAAAVHGGAEHTCTGARA